MADLRASKHSTGKLMTLTKCVCVCVNDLSTSEAGCYVLCKKHCRDWSLVRGETRVNGVRSDAWNLLNFTLVLSCHSG